MGIPAFTPGCFGAAACLVAALALMTTPESKAAEPLLVQPSPPAAADAGPAKPGQCPPTDTLVQLTRLASDQPTAIAALVAERVAAQDPQGPQDQAAGDSRCRCVAEVAIALAPVHPARASELRQALAERFPECGIEVTAGMEESLAASPSAGRAPNVTPNGPSVPDPGSSDGSGGGSGGGCSSRCAPIEPADDDVVSRTGR
jgi:hypothetical protein